MREKTIGKRARKIPLPAKIVAELKQLESDIASGKITENDGTGLEEMMMRANRRKALRRRA